MLPIRAYLIFIIALCASSTLVVAKSTPPIEVYFSPHGGCTEAVCAELGKAKETVYVQAYSFTSKEIAAALVEAHKRGAHVEIVLDKSQRSERYSSADFVSRAGIPTTIDDRHAIAHNKVIVIDGEVVITGSFNFTKAAEESNAENLLVIHDAELAAKYMANLKVHLEHAVTYEKPSSTDRIPRPKLPGQM
jgi:phosphatidylserine/phosphatidylglycerophosphate/cardiolipin synthase-like enzyme